MDPQEQRLLGVLGGEGLEGFAGVAFLPVGVEHGLADALVG